LIHVVVIAPTLAIRTGLRALLESDESIEVIAEAPSLDSPDTASPEADVFVISGEAAGREALEQALASLDETIGVLILADQPDSVEPLTGLPVRAWGLLPLDASMEELSAAVYAVQEGLVVGAPPLLEPLLSRPLTISDDSAAVTEALTEREAEVLEYLAQGLANKQIAAVLTISEHTVKFHVSSIYSKLGATNRAEAVRLGARQGLIVL
jgi:DNA-binding NarL/FixJ family response regulator